MSSDRNRLSPGHNYSEPTYSWSEDYSYCTATTTCLNNYNHVKEEQVVTTANRELTCDYEGDVIYTAEFISSRFTTQTVTVYRISLAHDYSKELKSDKKSHWYQCKNCSARKGEESHEFGKWKVDEEAGIFLEGVKHRSCSCGYEEERTIPRQNFIDAITSGDLTTFDKYVVFGGGAVLGLVLIIALIKIIFRKKIY